MKLITMQTKKLKQRGVLVVCEMFSFIQCYRLQKKYKMENEFSIQITV